MSDEKLTALERRYAQTGLPSDRRLLARALKRAGNAERLNSLYEPLLPKHREEYLEEGFIRPRDRENLIRILKCHDENEFETSLAGEALERPDYSLIMLCCTTSREFSTFPDYPFAHGEFHDVLHFEVEPTVQQEFEEKRDDAPWNRIARFSTVRIGGRQGPPQAGPDPYGLENNILPVTVSPWTHEVYEGRFSTHDHAEAVLNGTRFRITYHNPHDYGLPPGRRLRL